MAGPETRVALVLSCEHAGHRVPRFLPAGLQARLRSARALLEGHRGWDPGALRLARRLARRQGAPLHAATWSRLVVDPNRSAHNPRVFSEYLKDLSRGEKQAILERLWIPHRSALEARIAARVAAGERVVHVAVHSFTPRLRGRVRRCDVALLYDPARRTERDFCARWLRGLGDLDPGLRLRRNYPYRGRDDGLTTHLRTCFGPNDYRGIELEVNQERLVPDGPRPRALARLLAESLERILSTPSNLGAE